LAIVGVATTLSLAADLQTVEKVRIVLGAVAPTPIRVREAEEILTGQTISDDRLSQAGAAAARAARPISDVRASAEYRREQCDVLTQRAIRQTAARIRGN
ncbi:MAG TPA: xanthine dehydrogenase family protein subunit M, partial [Chloroflexota bacterium]|nr:xanthine dehydrogenase family protein subunit M [Chloroflexota bacterium]